MHWSSLPISIFSQSYTLNIFKSRVNNHLLSLFHDELNYKLVSEDHPFIKEFMTFLALMNHIKYFIKFLSTVVMILAGKCARVTWLPGLNAGFGKDVRCVKCTGDIPVLCCTSFPTAGGNTSKQIIFSLL